jgi:hypothetical protein
MTAEDWYLNGDIAQRRTRRPANAPTNPPAELRHSPASWPETWGKWPGVPKAVRQAQIPLKGVLDEIADSLPTLGLV